MRFGLRSKQDWPPWSNNSQTHRRKKSSLERIGLWWVGQFVSPVCFHTLINLFIPTRVFFYFFISPQFKHRQNLVKAIARKSYRQKKLQWIYHNPKTLRKQMSLHNFWSSTLEVITLRLHLSNVLEHLPPSLLIPWSCSYLHWDYRSCSKIIEPHFIPMMVRWARASN